VKPAQSSGPGDVDVVDQGFHVREVTVRPDVAPGVARRGHAQRIVVVAGPRHGVLPAAVDAHVLVSHVGHAAGDHAVGGLANERVGDVRVMGVPVVPAHRGRQRQHVAGHDLQRPLRLAVPVRGPQHDPVLAPRRRRAAEDAGDAVQLQRSGQPRGGKADGPLSAGRNAIQKRIARAAAVDFRAVDLRRGTGFGREDGLGRRMAREPQQRDRNPAIQRQGGSHRDVLYGIIAHWMLFLVILQGLNHLETEKGTPKVLAK